jgi:hypothetical protein
VFKKEEVKEGNNEISRKKRKEGELKTVKGSKKGHTLFRQKQVQNGPP